MKARAPKQAPTVRNEAYYQAMVEIRRSSATQRHTPKPRKGTRSAKRNAAIREES